MCVSSELASVDLLCDLVTWMYSCPESGKVRAETKDYVVVPIVPMWGYVECSVYAIVVYLNSTCEDGSSVVSDCLTLVPVVWACDGADDGCCDLSPAAGPLCLGMISSE